MLLAVSFVVLSTAILAFSGVAIGTPVVMQPDGLTLKIVHTNDMHSRFEQTSKWSTVCVKRDIEAGNCYGGFARIATLVREARKSSIPCIFLNAGDTYQGSTWFTVYKWKVVSKFLNLLAPNATSLGNHEFDDGVNGLIPFIENAAFPVLTSNMDLSRQPNLAATKLQKSTVLTVNGVKIGVIGYLTSETKILSQSENVIFLDEVESIRKEAGILKEQGVRILIALGHSGFEVDKKIAREVEDIDIVIGGHTNTFLYNGEQPDAEVPEGLYPTVVRQAADILKELEEMRGAIDNISLTEVGNTRVLLEGGSKVCRRRECNIGNLITDAMIDYNVKEYAGRTGWTDTAIAFHNGGSIRSSITRANDDKVTMGDILTVLPFHNTIIKVSMTGELIKSVLEWSVYNLEINNTANLDGAFLQFSGLQVIYDLTQPKNSKVVSVQVLCALCSIPMYNELQKNENYSVLLPDFMQSGGDGYSMLKDLQAVPIGGTTDEALVEYLKRHSPVHPGVEWRITFVNGQKGRGVSNSVHQSFRLTILLSIISWLFVR
ncbi:Protein 5NUC [Habropoda laboriosa]|uniref:5'-nucleotidase n=1 Tax=Habropoda laboriosa TaxID=597456 RepID=A0A0L7RCN2_9HYME|nr:Protein 5NUC [Habropoda laboriosa]